LAIAHATRGERVRQYDIEVPYGTQRGGTNDVHLHRNGEPFLTWTLESSGCVAPEPYASVPWRGGFLRWADEHLDPDTAEAAIVLRRACDISNLERVRVASELGIAGSGVCYTFQEETARVAFRQIGTIRDFDGRVDDLLAEGPHA
jgi:hypothetical protein